ncbi:hypothetical protein GCM10027562_28630 [Arthrobacter pigmenti]
MRNDVSQSSTPSEPNSDTSVCADIGTRSPIGMWSTACAARDQSELLVSILTVTLTANVVPRA